jgi:hypothetical protein
MGRWIRRWQRPDPGRTRRRCGRRGAATDQLHRLLGRGRVALRDSRRPGVGGHQRSGRVRPAARGGDAARFGDSSAARLPGLDVPTLREQGVDLEFENWRSLVAPPGLAATDRARLETLVAGMAGSKPWHEMLDRYRWLDRYHGRRRVRAVRRRRRGRVSGTSFASSGRDGTRAERRGRSELYPLFVLAGLVLAGLAAGTTCVAVAPARCRYRSSAPCRSRSWRRASSCICSW